jgi:RimJ/RimL family protein N-acetyltransferase
MNPPVSARLRLRPFAPEDVELLRRLHQHPEVAATLGGVRTDEEVRGFARRYVAHWEAHGFGLRVWEDRRTGEPVGRGGLHVLMLDGRPEVEVGWAIVRERWGEGLATEGGGASLAEAWGTLGLREVVAVTLPDNHTSRRVMAKLGMTAEKEVMKGGLPHLLHRLRRPHGIGPGPGVARVA